MLSAIRAWFTALSTVAKVGVVTTAVVAGGVTTSVATNHNTSPQSQGPSTQAPAIACKSTKTTTTATQAIPFTKKSISDSSMAEGQSYIQATGVNGKETLTYANTTYSPAGCWQDTKFLTKSIVTTEPVAQVTVVGTYVATVQPNCPNGTYVNSVGNVVCNPYSSPSVPPGATAQCVDGTYSFSQSRSGTCSHHGGVAQWL